MPQTKFWVEMTWTDFQARDMARAIAVLPLAATEQHGPHLPLGTDTFIMEGYIAQVVPRVPDELAVLFLPVQNCGLSIEHTDFPARSVFRREPLSPPGQNFANASIAPAAASWFF
jgi:creatinine amidohydrolase